VQPGNYCSKIADFGWFDAGFDFDRIGAEFDARAADVVAFDAVVAGCC
jgi:hypothetical protein